MEVSVTLLAIRYIELTPCLRVSQGTLLGPRRFQDIKDTALQALHRLRDDETFRTTVKDIREADATISALLKRQSPDNTPAVVVQDYDNTGLVKAQRLLKARIMRIESLKKLLATPPEADT